MAHDSLFRSFVFHRAKGFGSHVFMEEASMQSDANAQAKTTGKANFAGLDAIRAFAALGVVALHAKIAIMVTI